MKALVLDAWGGPFKLKEVPVPKAGAGHALVKVKACGIGLTLRWVREGRLGGTAPRIIGHEIAGDVMEVGPQVTNVKVGDRVTCTFYMTCGYCEFCRKNRETLCRNFRGYVGSSIDGGFAEYVSLPAENLLQLPASIPYAEACIIPDAIGTPLHAIRERAHVQPLDTVMVVGAAGGVGIHTVQMAKLFGGRVIAADTNDERLAKTKELGADEVINVTREDSVAAVKQLTDGRGVNAIVDFVCSAETLDKDFRSLDRTGRLVCMAAGRVAAGKASLGTVEPGAIVSNEMVITGSRCCTKQEVVETIELVRRGLIKSIVTETFSLADVPKAMERVEAGKVFGRAVMVT